MVETHGVVPLNKVQLILRPQQRDGVGALQLLSHPPEAVKVQRSLPLQQLDCHIAVRLDPGPGQPQLFPQRPVVLNHSVVGQGKGSPLDATQKGGVL